MHVTQSSRASGGPLTADLRLRRDGFELQVTLTAEPGRPLVVVGQSGAGKTTLLDLVAGVTVPESGRVSLGEDVWFDHDVPDATVPAYRRSIGYVAQHPTLFPHLSVEENVAFGLRASGVARRPALERARAALDELGIGEYATRKPDALSGGQRQRVTLARALCLDPRVLLLDEPLSALDVAARQSMRGEIRRVLTRLGCVTIYVTHDPLEALSFGDHIAVMEDGRVTQTGTRGELLRRPRSPYVGRFVGVNVFRGVVKSEPDGGVTHVQVGDATLAVADADGDGEMFVAIAPHNVTLSLEAPTGSARNVFQGTVEEVVPTLPLGDRVRVQLATSPPLVAEVTREAAEGMRLRPGVVVYASVKATGAEVYR